MLLNSKYMSLNQNSGFFHGYFVATLLDEFALLCIDSTLSSSRPSFYGLHCRLKDVNNLAFEFCLCGIFQPLQ